MENQGSFSPPESSVHGILQARILEWVAVPSLLQGIFPTPGLNPTQVWWWVHVTTTAGGESLLITSVFSVGRKRGDQRGEKTRKVGVGGLMKKERGISRLGEWRTCTLGKGWRVADQRKGPHRREVTVVDVNGAQTGSAGHEQVQAWAQRELELGQGSKTECRGLRRAGWPRERWPQHMSEAEPFWWKSDDRGCPGPLKRLRGLRFSPPAKSQRSPGNRGSELVGEEEGARERGSENGDCVRPVQDPPNLIYREASDQQGEFVN